MTATRCLLRFTRDSDENTLYLAVSARELAEAIQTLENPLFAPIEAYDLVKRALDAYYKEPW